MNTAHFSDVSALMQSYFDGLYRADSTLLRQVFHPKLAYVCATHGDELYLDLESYMTRIDQRAPPEARGEPRNDQMFDITFHTPRLAHVTAQMTMMERDYVDHLTLVPLDGAWRIVTKVFTFSPKED